MDACAPDALLARVISTLGAEPTGLPSAGLNVPMVRVVMFSAYCKKSGKAKCMNQARQPLDRPVDGKRAST
jgi:hypothetical protein